MLCLWPLNARTQIFLTTLYKCDDTIESHAVRKEVYEYLTDITVVPIYYLHFVYAFRKVWLITTEDTVIDDQ